MTRLAAIVCSLTLFLAFAGATASARTVAKGDDEFVVVIDAGHGGKDVGALGAFTNEKSINLAVARELRDILSDEAPHITTVMTRSKDVFVTLSGRAAIANKAGGDLFVSIHTNSVDPKNPRRKTVSGAAVYTLGLGESRTGENLAVAMRENAVMTLEPDFSTTYEGFDPNSAESYIIFEMDCDLHREQSIAAAKAVQDALVADAGRSDHGVRQAGFLVLRATAMPAMLVELDFICNPTQERYMASDEGREQLARAIATGITRYCDDALRHRAILAGKTPPARRASIAKAPRAKDKGKEKNKDNDKTKDKDKDKDKARAADGAPVALDGPADTVLYRIQVMSSPTVLKASDSRVRDLPCGDAAYYLHGGVAKYTVGRFTSLAEAEAALPKVRRRFADAFIIRTRGPERL